MTTKVLIVGGGAAGMMCAITAARSGARVQLLEKNEKLGKKLFITGKGRCNLTNACDVAEIFDRVVHNPKFLYSCLYGFSNQDTQAFFEALGLPLKIERGERVFPASDKSSDVIKVLERELRRLDVEIMLRSEVTEVVADDGGFSHLVLADGRKLYGAGCVIATGGRSYPATGSTGDGYAFARRLHHTIVPPRPALVPLEAGEAWVGELQGLSLKNVRVAIYHKKKCLFTDFGEMLFTHYGVSGPLLLSASSVIGEELEKHPLRLEIDLKPALGETKLEERLLREFAENQNKQFKNIAGHLLPAKLVPVALRYGGIDGRKPANEISRAERQAFVAYLKHFTLTLTALRGFREAIITSGGVKVSEVDPGTCASRKVPGLYFCGEVLDLDAQTGGFNLQIAWSSAYAAGQAAGAPTRE